MFRFIPREDYRPVPWENGLGMTSDIALFPEGATRQNFDIRVSMAPITADSLFSLFSGIDRHITLLKGAGLKLDFRSRSLRLRALHPVSFDNGEPPFARLVDGPVEVLNIMTRRGRWTARVEVLRQNANVLTGRHEFGIIFVAEGEWVAEGDGGSHTLRNGGTGIITQPCAMTLSAGPPAAIIFARLTLV
jgi:environmental stress-induced protein Ves